MRAECSDGIPSDTLKMLQDDTYGNQMSIAVLPLGPLTIPYVEEE